MAGEEQLGFPHGHLQGVQFALLAIQGWLWWKSSTGKAQSDSKGLSFRPPVGIIEPSKLADEDAEAVKENACEERLEEGELQRIVAFDKPQEIKRDVEFGDGRVFEEDIVGTLTDAAVCQPVVEAPTAAATSSSSSSAAMVPSILPSTPVATTLQSSHGLDVPTTPREHARKYLGVLVWLLSRAPGRCRESTWAKLSYTSG